MNHFGKIIYKNDDCGVSIGTGKTCDKTQGNVRPVSLGEGV